jgi:3-isopropylmalate/(R)-2-methylmalate dehydratase small subunit
MKNKTTEITSKVVMLPLNNIDTDQIIPARYLKIINKEGLGKKLFADWRYDKDGNRNTDFVINLPESSQAKILFVGENFGCGSSREHAPWALKDFGFQAIIALSFADIFRTNAIKNGILPVVISEKYHNILEDTIEEIPGIEINIDIEAQKIMLPTGSDIPFQIDVFSKRAIIENLDEMDYLISNLKNIESYERSHIID